MSEIQGRVRVPRVVRRGENIEIKTTINHPMENGRNKDKDGKIIDIKYIKDFKCFYNDKEIFRSEWHPSISANPFLSFFIRARESGNISFEWIENTGKVFKKSAEIIVES